MRKFLFAHLKRFLRIKFHLIGLIQSCKSHPLWDLQPPEFVSYVEDLEGQLRIVESGIYEFQMELEVNLMRGQM